MDNILFITIFFILLKKNPDLPIRMSNPLHGTTIYSENNDYIEFDIVQKTGPRCIPVDMEAYRYFLDQLKSDHINIKAEELFMSTVFANPMIIKTGTYSKNFPMERVKRYFERDAKPLVKTLREWYYATGFGALKPVIQEDGIYEMRPVSPEDCRIYMVRELAKTRLILQWKEQGSPNTEIEFVTQNAGTTKRKLHFDNRIVWFIADMPDFVSDNTMRYIDIIDQYLCGFTVSEPMTLLKWRTAFKSKLIASLFTSLSYLRLVETQQRIEDNKLDRSLFLENTIPYREEEYRNYQRFSEVKYDNVLQVSESMKQFIGKNVKRLSKIRDPRIDQVGPNSMFGSFARDNTPNRDEVDTKYEKRLENQGNVELVRRAYDGHLQMSRGIFNTVIRNPDTGRNVFSGAPNQKFVWEQKSSGSRNDIAFETENTNSVKCNLFGIPMASISQKSTSDRVQITREAREDMRRRFQYVANETIAEFLGTRVYHVVFQGALADEKELIRIIASETLKEFNGGISDEEEEGDSSGEDDDDDEEKKKTKMDRLDRKRMIDVEVLRKFGEIDTVHLEFCLSMETDVSDLISLYDLDIPESSKNAILSNLLERFDIHTPNHHDTGGLINPIKAKDELLPKKKVKKVKGEDASVKDDKTKSKKSTKRKDVERDDKDTKKIKHDSGE